jgi:hypothetical protein
MAKNDLIAMHKKTGIGENKWKGFIKKLIDEGQLLESTKTRKGKNHEKFVSRTPIPPETYTRDMDEQKHPPI